MLAYAGGSGASMQTTKVDPVPTQPGAAALAAITDLDPASLQRLLESTGSTPGSGVHLDQVLPAGTTRSNGDGASGAEPTAQANPVACCRVLPV
ncbi:hypothetical protein [Plantactinospora soyae]|uniref:Uncharacterized protein n=1 Tax=Plantactinospora soyae TaxID=1544732 RepID=A0A927R5D2_9ACTN|nr:hypothetical protein [Plantactinospora soyae]MBE1487379.1 hypothetical protein [Plantactinospora soyae]